MRRPPDEFQLDVDRRPFEYNTIKALCVICQDLCMHVTYELSGGVLAPATSDQVNLLTCGEFLRY